MYSKVFIQNLWLPDEISTAVKLTLFCWRFPGSDDTEEDSFDDAYLSGEIVSILMKKEKFDDPRLLEHMVKWGRVMGIGEIQKMSLIVFKLRIV